MIGRASTRLGWTQATALSLLLHGAGIATVVGWPEWQRSTPAPETSARLELDLSALTTTTQPEAPTLTPVTATETPSESLPPAQPVSVSTPPGTELFIPLLPDPKLTLVDPLPLMDGPALPETAASGGVTPASPGMAELLDRIRGRLDETCLLALPALRDDDQIHLGVLAADDRRVSGLLRELTQGLGAEVTETAVLLDRRQCPALDFIRRDPRYPLPGLGLQIETQDIASGGNLRGRILGAGGAYTTLLLIDDNGVVHDLRRFQIASVGTTQFEVPLARTGGARDTHQLLLAIASPLRPDTISTHEGDLAEVFFDRLSRDRATADARFGIGSVYVR